MRNALRRAFCNTFDLHWNNNRYWKPIFVLVLSGRWRQVRLAPLNRFKPSSKIFYRPFHGSTSFVDLFWFCSVLCLLCLCARLFICALWSPAGKGLISWLSFVVSNCEFVIFPLVSWVRCGTWLYRYLIFAPLLTLLCIFDYESLLTPSWKSFWSRSIHAWVMHGNGKHLSMHHSTNSIISDVKL